MDNDRNKTCKGVKQVEPRFDNDQLGENASGEPNPSDYQNKGAKSKKR